MGNIVPFAHPEHSVLRVVPKSYASDLTDCNIMITTIGNASQLYLNVGCAVRQYIKW